MTWLVILGFGGYVVWCSKGQVFSKNTAVLRSFLDALGFIFIVVGLLGLLGNAGARIEFPWWKFAVGAAILLLLQFVALWDRLIWIARPYRGPLLNRLLLGIAVVGILETIINQF